MSSISRHYAARFYEKLGYTICSDVFQEVGMDHFAMEKDLVSANENQK